MSFVNGPTNAGNAAANAQNLQDADAQPANTAAFGNQNFQANDAAAPPATIARSYVKKHPEMARFQPAGPRDMPQDVPKFLSFAADNRLSIASNSSLVRESRDFAFAPVTDQMLADAGIEGHTGTHAAPFEEAAKMTEVFDYSGHDNAPMRPDDARDLKDAAEVEQAKTKKEMNRLGESKAFSVFNTLTGGRFEIDSSKVAEFLENHDGAGKTSFLGMYNEIRAVTSRKT